LLCNSCCRKTHCPGDELPTITIKMSQPIHEIEIVTLYTLENGKVDSTFFHVYGDTASFNFFPMNDFDDANVMQRQFVLRHKNKSDTISHVAAVFRDVEIACGDRWGCGRRGNNKQMIKKLMHFSFLYRGKKHKLGEPAILD
jgi:hypothetical protein